ncbi:MAG: prepilin-type N-terminal cleavage/methylation domain-containing protein [Peptostreptococcaceae bacterium]|nr:prepilin-type N-terminal cleavage/methylation domain-containing protein [Peptostreptococcaceae bacterium]
MNMKNIKTHTNSIKGFTLIELLVAIAIMAIVMVPMTMLSINGITSYYHEMEKIELMESARFSLFKITKQIRLSDQPVISDTETENAENDSIIVMLNGKSYKYQLSDSNPTNLIEKIDGGAENAIAENISIFDLSADGDLLTIDIELTGPKYGEVVNLKTAIYLRNQ